MRCPRHQPSGLRLLRIDWSDIRVDIDCRPRFDIQRSQAPYRLRPYRRGKLEELPAVIILAVQEPICEPFMKRRRITVEDSDFALIVPDGHFGNPDGAVGDEHRLSGFQFQ